MKWPQFFKEQWGFGEIRMPGSRKSLLSIRLIFQRRSSQPWRMRDFWPDSIRRFCWEIHEKLGCLWGLLYWDLSQILCSAVILGEPARIRETGTRSWKSRTRINAPRWLRLPEHNDIIHYFLKFKYLPAHTFARGRKQSTYARPISQRPHGHHFWQLSPAKSIPTNSRPNWYAPRVQIVYATSKHPNIERPTSNAACLWNWKLHRATIIHFHA